MEESKKKLNQFSLTELLNQRSKEVATQGQADTAGEETENTASKKKLNQFSLTELLNQRSKEVAHAGQQGTAGAEKDTTTTTASTTADIYDLTPSKNNFYSVEDVKDLKQSIELLGVLQPILVTSEEDGKWRIIAGHRRRLAIMQLVEEGKERFRYVPIIVRPTKNAILDRLALIMTNRFREKTDWEKMTESIETEKLVQELKEQMDIPGRTRDLLAEIINASPAQLGRYKAIYSNLTEELMEEFKAGKIGVSVIYEISGLEKEWQLRALEVFRENGTLTLTDAKEIKRQQEAAAQVPGQMNIAEINGQQDIMEDAQTDETEEGRENTEEGGKTEAERAGETQEDLCETCTHNGECAQKKTHDSGCLGYEPLEELMNQPEEYEDPQPESIIPLCYSCTQYETCHEKKATVTSCNAYEDRREAYKTDEQRYNEEQAKIDAETRQKLQERKREEVMKQGPGEKKHKEIQLGTRRYNEIRNGTLSFLLTQKDDYKVNEELQLIEYADGRKTGREMDVAINYIWEDWTGLDDNYCIIGFVVNWDKLLIEENYGGNLKR